MPMHISRLGFQAILEAAQEDDSVRRFIQIQGHTIVILDEDPREAEAKNQQAVDALLRAVEEEDDTDYSVPL